MWVGGTLAVRLLPLATLGATLSGRGRRAGGSTRTSRGGGDGGVSGGLDYLLGTTQTVTNVAHAREHGLLGVNKKKYRSQQSECDCDRTFTREDVTPRYE